MSESSPDPAPGPGLDKPDHGGTPDWTLAQDCEATKLLIEQMRAALRHAPRRAGQAGAARASALARPRPEAPPVTTSMRSMSARQVSGESSFGAVQTSGTEASMESPSM